MKPNPLRTLGTLGQSLWLDDINRDLLTRGGLKTMIEQDGLRGMTSNPPLFEKAIVGGKADQTDIRAIARAQTTPMAIYEALTLSDVRRAADEFRTLYDRTDGGDGYVSLEVNPHLARETHGTIAEARRLWQALDRPNVMIKVPATAQGVPAVEQLITEGINVNVTLLFSLPRYREVAQAYCAAIAARMMQRKPVARVTSVASFFLSRIDTALDHLLEKIIAEGGDRAEIARRILGQTAIAGAKQAYRIYKEIFEAEPFLSSSSAQGARPQRLLWTSTGIKNPRFSDVKYIDALIGPHTACAAPPKTIDAYRDHGDPKARLEENVDEAAALLKNLTTLGISLDQTTRRLEDEGIETFNESFDRLLKKIEEERARHGSERGASSRPAFRSRS